MSATPAARLLRAGVALSFGHMVMRGTRPDADLYDRLGATVLLACLVVDSRRDRRELAHHHQALQLLTDWVEGLAVPLGVAAADKHWAGPVLHSWPWLNCSICRPLR
jgi:hypothetical protein